MKKTALYEKHLELGAKMVPFAGWEMPVIYEGVPQEHRQVREKVGLFDVSHMGRIDIIGPDAEKLLETISTNKISGKKEGSVVYTVLCNDEGGCIDDTLIYRLNQEHFFLVANASNREADLTHLKKQAKPLRVEIREYYNDDGILALQGPFAMSLIRKIFPDLEDTPMRVYTQKWKDQTILISTTGYTGSGGIELFASNATIVALWDTLFELGAEFSMRPIGLGARDTLRLEMGFALYGHELNIDIHPIETIASWAVKMKKEHFIGRNSLEKLDNPRKQYGILLEKGGLPRQGFEVFHKETPIGVVTSGTHSPSLEQGIALVMVNQPLQEGEEVQIKIRKKLVKGKVHTLPFIKK